MADQEPGAIFGFDDPNLGAGPSYIDDNTAPTSIESGPSGPGNHHRITPDGQFFYDSSNWTYQEPPGYSFNFTAPATTGASADPLFQTAPWELPSGHPHQQQQQPQQPQRDSPGLQPGLDQLSHPEHPVSHSTVVARAPPAHPSNAPAPGTIGLLTPAQQEKLRNIAMPAHLQYHSPKSEASPLSASSDPRVPTALSSPDAADPTRSLSRKRKSSADAEDEEEEDENGQPVKKTAHNMIEKRYRTNLNDKIAALRDSVPSLRIMSKSARGEDTTEDREELHGLTPAHKLNKATVLSKATEYIRHLEKRNNRLLDENSAMQARIAAFEKLFMAGAMTGAMSPMHQPPTPMQYPQDQYIGATPAGTPQDGQNHAQAQGQPQGMIQVPDDMKRILTAQMSNQPYPVPAQPYRGNQAMLRQQQIQQQQQQFQQGGRWGNAGPYFGKLMVGSLAGLMIIEAVRTEEQSNEKPEGRGLFALPVNLLSSLGSNASVHVAGHAVSAARLISHIKVLLFIGLLLWVFVPSLFAPSTKSKKGQQQISGSLQAAPSLASPIHVRRQAWLTAIQTVWVPEHNFFLEAAALVLKTMKLSLRNMIGTHGYQMLTGLTEDQETARVKAWSIALDAQLAGGDVEINKSRLTLTLLASGTLPNTPLRLMLKALHIRVLLWDFGSSGFHNGIAVKHARNQWNEAKQLNKVLSQLRKTANQPSDDYLPDHLAALLEHDCDEILNNSLIQRAYNLAWNLATTENALEKSEGIDAVVEDQAVRSPMDAVAAWWSGQEVQRALMASLASDKEEGEARKVVASHLENAMKAAPIATDAQARALVARAVLVDEKRGTHIAAAVQSVQPTDNTHAATELKLPMFEASASAAPSPDAQVALQCAMAMAHLQRGKSDSSIPYEAIQLVEKIARPGTTAITSLLGCTALFKLMTELHSQTASTEVFGASLERLAGSLRIWIGSEPGDQCGLGQEVRHAMVDRCLKITKSVVGMETDAGYGSMSDCEDEAGC